MEIDSDNTKVPLREVATKIFEDKVKASYERASSSKPLKTWEQFKSEYPDYVEDSISFIEANLIFSKYIVSESTFQLAVECSFACQKRLI